MTSTPLPSRVAHVTSERRQEAQAERPMGGVHVVVAKPEWRHRHIATVPGERALELVLVRILVSAVCLRAVELPPALVSAHRLHLHSVRAPLVPPDILQSTLPSKYHQQKNVR